MAEPEMICGIEIHQQLDTKKLFCSCDSHLCEEGHGSVYRRLRPTTSEMGEVDRAALAQFQRNLGYRYQSAEGTVVSSNWMRNLLTVPTPKRWRPRSYSRR